MPKKLLLVLAVFLLLLVAGDVLSYMTRWETPAPAEAQPCTPSHPCPHAQ